ncbi:hypothetical protein PPERSA_11816 [Pseudocohnilembus persalinus]|uniref:RING-type E3 ubiquitin transferase n=1 Tax=Pseudocohnilembus persalinus TaxID=266149 RepID=A0A0V0QRY0_PSEPJ|nr:hypothetical protein PPERSA_11816 [Pseudocohnilembus persalinus]|eukprot:KRX04760.1 hypothetical protein PPERSA_11816 [Pseudocohnilembus persalinus]
MEELLQDNCLEEKDNLLEQIQSHLKNKITKVHTDIPQHFVCPITYDILDYGVTAESGFTYKDEKILREHFVKNGNRDPMTRDALNANIIIQNQAIQQAVADYKDKNPQYYEADNFGDDDELL